MRSCLIIMVWILLAKGIALQNSNKTLSIPEKVKTRKLQISGERPILGGFYTTINRYPFFAGVIVKAMERYDRNFQDPQLTCGSTVVAPRWVMTSGSCLFLITVYEVDIYDLIIRTGATVWNITCNVTQPNMKDYDVDSIHVVDDYITLGLIKIKQEFHESNIIKVTGLNYKLKVGSNCVIVGYEAITQDIILSGNRLKRADLVIVPQKDCKRYSNVSISESIPTIHSFCAKWPRADRKVCFFEIGAPVVQEQGLIGIMNAQIMCGTNKVFQYIRVSQFQRLITYLEIRIQERIGIHFVND